MIVEWLVDFTLGLVATLFSLIPFPEDLDLGAFGPAFGAMMTLNGAFPVTEALQGTVIIGTVTGAMFVLKLVQMLAAHIPWIGGSGG